MQPQEEPEELVAARAKLADSKLSGEECHYTGATLCIVAYRAYMLSIYGDVKDCTCIQCVPSLPRLSWYKSVYTAEPSSCAVSAGSATSAQTPTMDQPLQELSIANGNIGEPERQSEVKAEAAVLEVQESAGDPQADTQVHPEADAPTALFARAGHEVTSVVNGLSDDEDDVKREFKSHIHTSTPYGELD